MKERPTLFSAPMVRAILRDVDPKTQTRRIVKFPKTGAIETPEWRIRSGVNIWVAEHDQPGCPYAYQEYVKCPYGDLGEQLWVKETFIAWGRWETRFSSKKKRDEWHFVDMTLECGKEYLYAADNEIGLSPRGSSAVPHRWKRPAIFMPRHASRITLEITGVRVERLQDISEEDAIAEGLDSVPSLAYPAERSWCDYRIPHDSFEWYRSPIDSYRSLWESINGAGSWSANPWVWVVEFKKLAGEVK